MVRKASKAAPGSDEAENGLLESSVLEIKPRGKSPSKAEAVRAAIEAGSGSPGAGVDYVQTHYGLEITKPHFSAIKSQYKKALAKRKGKVGRPPKTSFDGYLAPPPPRSKDIGESDLLIAMEAMKPFVDSLGADKVKRIVDLLG